MGNQKNEKLQVKMAVSQEELDLVMKIAKERGISSEIEVTEIEKEDNTLSSKELVEKLNKAELPRELISQDIEKFTEYKVKKLLESGEIDGTKSEANRIGYRFDLESVENFIKRRKTTKEQLQQRIEDLEKERDDWREQALAALAKSEKIDSDEVCEGQTSIDDYIEETAEKGSDNASEQVETDIFAEHLEEKEVVLKKEKENEQDQSEQIETVVESIEEQLIEFFSANKRKRPNTKKVEMMLIDIFSIEEKELKEMSAELKWKTLKEQCLDKGTDKKYILEQLKSY